MAYRGALDGLRPRKQVEGKAQRTDKGGRVSHPHRSREVPKVLEEPQSVGPFRQLAMFVRSQAGRDEVLDLPRVVDGRDQAAVSSRQLPGALHNFAQHGVDIEACSDANAGRGELGDVVPQPFYLLSEFLGIPQLPNLTESKSETRFSGGNRRLGAGSGLKKYRASSALNISPCRKKSPYIHQIITRIDADLTLKSLLVSEFACDLPFLRLGVRPRLTL